MSEAVLTGRLEPAAGADTALRRAAALWFVVAVAGQWLFAYYIFVFYGGTAMQGDWAAWTARLPNGILEGDAAGNLALIVHIALAFVITVGGPLQLIPQIREHMPVVHRWTGRIYIPTAMVISLGAIYLIWAREAVVGGVIGQIAITLNGVLIMLCAAMTVRHALARNFDVHRRWAMRTFIAASGVWFFRVGFGLWIFLNAGSAPGSNQTLTGPFDVFLYFACFLLPLAILEVYLRAQERAGPLVKTTVAAGLVVLAAGTGAGIFMAAQIFWLPNL